EIAPNAAAQNYLINVLRLRPGDAILLFNGHDGEWRAKIETVSRRAAALRVENQVREQTAPNDLDYAFAPLKQARLDYVVQKATEMGAARLTPVLTKRTQMRRVSAHRLRANAIEAAEQCGLLTIPETGEPLELDRYLAELDPQRLLVFCDEDAPATDPLAPLHCKSAELGGGPSVAVLIGPEGGFDETERALILRHGNVLRISLGPRILRADTAAVAALALVQATLGDWR
ncbi:MAG TPA: 16S rRNA (uracil(1498)-N(3))-methyltransferase, partial [Methylocystis sp.]|nr:16S rRNA (uracil(1498)-N(3))-methyltransferase [Methylocystis sp.]